ncbi:MAG: WD40 repeat domain-containing protein, partial [Planctomycetes bacterium]|nr:WD40 repeat domain-containing protein [Planctomycetota bacterium]
MSKTTKAMLAAVLVCCAVSTAHGKTWTTRQGSQFAAGKLEGVSVLSTGEVQLAPETKKVEGLQAEFVWDVEADSEGNVFLAAASPGGVYALKDGKLSKLYDAGKKQALSVLPMPDGSLLAAIAPDGVILRINRAGKVTQFAKLDCSYVWDMAWCPAARRIYCATGPGGRLFELSRAGVAKELLKVAQDHLMCVAVDDEGTVYFGTAPDGYVFQLDRNGKSRLLYDADESEVHDLIVTSDKTIFACTAAGRSEGPPRPPDK